MLIYYQTICSGAADNAVTAAEEVVSASSGLKSKVSAGIEANDGVSTVSDELNDPSKTQDNNKDLDAQHAVEGIDTPDDNDPLHGTDEHTTDDETKTLAPPQNPYDLVSTLLSGSATGVKEAEFPLDDSHSAQVDHSDALSDGERDAFDQIAATLIDEPVEKQNDLEDTKRSEPSIVAASNLFDTKSNGKEDDGDDTREAHQSQLRQALKTRPQADETLRSAASTAFRDILAMDPAFRHMRGHMSELTGETQDNSSDKNVSTAEAPTIEATELVENTRAEQDIDHTG